MTVQAPSDAIVEGFSKSDGGLSIQRDLALRSSRSAEPTGNFAGGTGRLDRQDSMRGEHVVQNTGDFGVRLLGRNTDTFEDDARFLDRELCRGVYRQGRHQPRTFEV